MAKKYQEVPLNFSSFEDYLIDKKEEVVDAFTKAHQYFFYDTCSILHHSNSANRQTIINYLKSKADIIFVTRTVLMELTANSFELHSAQIQYFKELNDSGFKIALFDEELIYDCLKEALNISTEEANRLLGYAIKEVCRYKAKVNEIVENMDRHMSGKLKSTNPGNRELFGAFFRYARTQKSEGDSLAEELILICIIVLTRIPMGRYILISDDMRIRPQVISVNDYILKHHGRKEPYQLTTSSLVYKMYKDNILTDKDDMIEIMKAAFKGNVNVFYVGEYDIEQRYESFKCEDLIDRLIKEKDFKIIY
ncbi:MAG TPA: transposase [Acetivibrio sp.]|uniref:transposase n=1 Tax=Acetivibrio sp. TaxID=1872092 RepID=UPI002C8A0BDD|nr:transposase [Acetivibrio sp.]HOM02148.1 transposase [Acetivibrio sp.]